MEQSKVERFILFSLGAWFEEANRNIEDKPLQVTISRRDFIELVMKAGFAEKQERALYKNLEALIKNKMILCENHDLKLTKKGEKGYLKIKKDIEPFITVLAKLSVNSPTSYAKKVQTVFR